MAYINGIGIEFSGLINRYQKMINFAIDSSLIYLISNLKHLLYFNIVKMMNYLVQYSDYNNNTARSQEVNSS